MATQKQVDDYVHHLVEDLARAQRTVDGAREELELLIERRVALTPKALSHFVNHKIDGTRLAPQSRNRRLTILRGFVAFLRRKKIIRRNPIATLKRARVPPRTELATSFDELVIALAALGRRRPSWERTRDGTILLLLFYTALRVSELRGLDLNQVDLGRLAIRAVHRKGGRVEDVVLHPCARAALELYLSVRPHVSASALLLARHGDRPTVRNIQKMLARLGRSAALPGRLHPHALRHSCATELATAGVASALIQRHLAHQSLATTERYIHVLPGPVRTAVGALPSAPLQALMPSAVSASAGIRNNALGEADV